MRGLRILEDRAGTGVYRSDKLSTERVVVTLKTAVFQDKGKLCKAKPTHTNKFFCTYNQALGY